MAIAVLDRALRMGERKRFSSYEKLVRQIGRYEDELELVSNDELLAQADDLRLRVREQGQSLDDVLVEAFALGREAGRRALGMRHFDVQLIGAMALHDGSVAEMKTGEGKTLTATLAVFLNSLADQGVHLVTVNDYLARRDAEWMRPLYEALGMQVGVIQQQMDAGERREAYAADVTYGTNSEFGFDYLRDNLVQEQSAKVQRSQTYAIVDEVDNILIDEARTPLIISGQPEQAAETYHVFARLAKRLRGVEAKPRLKSQGDDPDSTPDGDYEYDEKHKTVAPTEAGVAKAERFLGVDNLYLSEHGTLVNHLIQSLKSESLYKRDRDYAVIEGEVHIIDEFTGRILEGRRWSEGLHQAIEAKEGVAIQEEHTTVASITYQNYFRRYEKLAGMTGTALTEATELMKIYEMPVIEIPTNREMIRADHHDLIYKTKAGKWRAVISEIAERNEKGQPVLVGTVSVETSEMVSTSLRRRGIDHVVLNAKPEHAEREGETIAEAGRRGAVTIATNMAGRGVDIMLGGSPKHLAEAALRKRGVGADGDDYKQLLSEETERLRIECQREREEVLEVGGLFVLGTERHESRRIDNQLRGRSGRQGDPGESRFMISAEDDLVRLFAGERIYRILDRLGPIDDEGEEVPIESGLLSKQIEKAQRRVEEQNFLIRKRVLEYDDVLNHQREVIYAYRDRILAGEEVAAEEQLGKIAARLVSEATADDYIAEWDLDGLRRRAEMLSPGLSEVIGDNPEDTAELEEAISAGLESRYGQQEETLGQELIREIERTVLLQIIDQRWHEHLADMDYLREGIGLRGLAQIDPLIAYKNEGFELFGALVESIWEEFVRYVLHAEVVSEPAPVEQRVRAERNSPGRNDPCWCGSGKKFKRCHGA